MGRRTVLVDDLDGTELPDDTSPIHLTLGRTTYALFLSEDNHGKLMEALTPFIENAETVDATIKTNAASRSASFANTQKEKLKAVRAWAQSTGYTYKNAKGEDVTLGDRGRIPDEVVAAYDAAN